MASIKQLKEELNILKQQGAEKDKIKAKEKEIGDREKRNLENRKKRLKVEQQLNAEFKRGTDAQKAAARFTKEQKQAEAALNVDIASRVTNLLKGNIAQGLALDFPKR